MFKYDYDTLSPGQSHLYQPDTNHDLNDLLLIKFAETVLLIKSKEFYRKLTVVFVSGTLNFTWGNAAITFVPPSLF